MAKHSTRYTLAQFKLECAKLVFKYKMHGANPPESRAELYRILSDAGYTWEPLHPAWILRRD